MQNIAIRTLSDTSMPTIHRAFALAFADYVEEFDLTLEQLIYMLERRGCDLNLSFGAFADNELVGFILNGTGTWNGKATAYDTGTGVIKGFRKQGIASKIFTESLPVLRQYQISQYLLEVIKTNTKAVDLYCKAGFQIVREFDYFVSPQNELTFEHAQHPANVHIKHIQANWPLFENFWDFKPSWQNSIEAIQRKKEFFTLLGIFENDEFRGYGFIEKHTGDIPQLAVAKQHRPEFVF